MDNLFVKYLGADDAIKVRNNESSDVVAERTSKLIRPN